ncbi:MAG: chromate transporter [Burkholderiales bacterium 68-12]|nr:MAG: chromate transporter [Burkholderiales bacterium 68-12]
MSAPTPFPSAGPADGPPRPQGPADLFWSFTWLALQGFGGVVAIVQRELVEKKRWMTNEEFLEDWAVAQVMPGPNVVNLSLMVGDRYFGLRGGLAALAGMLALPMLLALAATLAYAHWATHPAMAGALRGMGAVAAGLIGGMALKLAAALRTHVLGPWWCALLALATLAAVAWWRVPLYAVLLVLGGAACVFTWRRLAP